MNDFITSLIRTNVPILVGAFVAWLVSVNVQVPEGSELPLTIGLTAVLIAGYYSGVRWAETRWPWFGYLLGTKAEPTYDDKRAPGHDSGEALQQKIRELQTNLDRVERSAPLHAPEGDGRHRAES